MSKSLEKMRADKRVAEVTEEPDLYFVYLAPGWNWSGQTSFGCETLKEAWKFVRASQHEPES